MIRAGRTRKRSPALTRTTLSRGQVVANFKNTKTGRPIKDRIGLRYSSLVVVSFVSSDGKNARWQCRCDCGKFVTARGSNLTSGNVKSCGCRRGIVNRKRLTTHGCRHTSEYKAWRSIKLRCYAHTDQHFADYGGRGIVTCDGIRTAFECFLNAVGRKPFPRASIDRIDNERGYDCGQCEDCKQRMATNNLRWADYFQQSQNRRGNHKLTHNSLTLCIAEWSRRTGISSPTIRERIARGWTVKDALTVPAWSGHGARYSSKRIVAP